ncbi:MAG: dTDP-4-dehydrorhamnose 3,5-epimerase [Acidobacteria bacterium]|nr:dTDP-4-dehydrorhamnose 3,5-epimerase [Acidobacteriota bacterium]
MTIHPTNISDVLLLTSPVYHDDRGVFTETYQQAKLAELGLTLPFVQDNQSGSHQGVLRGLHYQIRQPQGKLVRVLSGEIYDVAVDLRRHSVTFGQWVGNNLSAQSRQQIWIPPGFAHGFYVLSEWAEVLYKTTDYYAPQWERTLLWNDPQLGIEWPLLPHKPVLISTKDAEGQLLSTAELFD